MTAELTSPILGGSGGWGMGALLLFSSSNLINALTYILLELGSPGKNVGHLTPGTLFIPWTSTYLYYYSYITVS